MRLDFFEGLVAILPILLFAVLSIFLRGRFSGRRRLQKDQEQGGAPPERSRRPLRSLRPPASHEYPKPLSAESLRAAGVSEAGRTSGRDYSEADIYPSARARAESFRPPEPASRKTVELGGPGQVFPPMQEAVLRPKSLVDRSGADTVAPSSRTRPSSIVQRLSSLPPLKRAVVWAEILGPPAARSEHRQ